MAGPGSGGRVTTLAQFTFLRGRRMPVAAPHLPSVFNPADPSGGDRARCKVAVLGSALPGAKLPLRRAALDWPRHLHDHFPAITDEGILSFENCTEPPKRLLLGGLGWSEDATNPSDVVLDVHVNGGVFATITSTRSSGNIYQYVELTLDAALASASSIWVTNGGTARLHCTALMRLVPLHDF